MNFYYHYYINYINENIGFLITVLHVIMVMNNNFDYNFNALKTLKIVM